jgi:hypothetical protein
MRRREELKTREAASSTRDSRKEINPALAGISATRGKGYDQVPYCMRRRFGKSGEKGRIHLQ